MRIYNLVLDSPLDAYRFDGRIFACIRAVRFAFPKAGDQITIALCDEKPGVKVTIGHEVVIHKWWWRRRRSYDSFYDRMHTELRELRREEPYYLRMMK